MYKFNSNYNIPPSETIKELLEVNNINIRDFAGRMKLTVEQCEGILNNTIRLDDYIASALESIFKIPKSFWYNLENKYVNKLKEDSDMGYYGKVKYKGLIYTVEIIEDNHYGLKELGEWVLKEYCEEIDE